MIVTYTKLGLNHSERGFTMKMSKSKVLCYEFCPKRFYWEYIEEKKLPPLPEMQRGIEIHEIVANALTQFTKLKVTSRNDMKNILWEIAGTTKGGEFWVPLNNFLDFEVQRNKEFVPLFAELKIETDGLSGIIDRVDMGADCYYIYDYKTGELGSYKNYVFELAFYQHLFMQMLNKRHNALQDNNFYLANDREIKVGIIGLDKRIRYTRKLTKNEVQGALDKVQEVKQKVQNQEFSQNLQNCKRCPCVSLCW